MKYHTFFTTKHTEACFKHGRFGAPTMNSLANVKKGDVAFLFDGLKWEIYGAIEIISNEQFHEDQEIYGVNEKGTAKYTNRVAIKCDTARCIKVNELFALEKNAKSDNFLLNRTLLSILISNKQVSSTPLTKMEGDYLLRMISMHGGKLPYCIGSSIYANKVLIKDHVVKGQRTMSEAFFEMLLLQDNQCKLIYPSQNSLVYNQFVLGFQRQIDILSINDGNITIIEIKKKGNLTNPYSQIKEYVDYANADYRLKEFVKDNTKVMAVVLLEEGNEFLNENSILPVNNLSVFRFKCDRSCKITISHFSSR